MKFRNLVIIILFLCSLLTFKMDFKVFADMDENIDVYSVYDENFNLLFQKDFVEVGDNYLSKDFKFYEIVYVDKDNFKCIAKFVKQMQKPQVELNKNPKQIKITDKKIAMYSTHNDESYVPTDGVDSIYGHGGIQDVVLRFKQELEKYFIDVYYDDTLHIPHDTSAYSRSLKTAKLLQDKYSPDAIFDMHRDGASRGFYVTKVNGIERGRVRMVIGKSNPNKSLNEEFAMYLMSVADELYPWLFTDIYYGSGHYNQGVDSKAILFEMGSHLVEKELMLNTTKELAEVINTALYGTTVNVETGEITINGNESEVEIPVSKVLDNKESSSSGVLIACIVVVVFAVVCSYIFVIFFYNAKKQTVKHKNNKNNLNNDKA